MKILRSIASKMTKAGRNKPKHIITPFTEDGVIQREGYRIVNMDPWAVGDIKGVRYRVIVPKGITDAQLIRIGNDLLRENKGCNDLVVWCWASFVEVINYIPYTVAMIEKSKNTGMRITRR